MIVYVCKYADCMGITLCAGMFSCHSFRLYISCRELDQRAVSFVYISQILLIVLLFNPTLGHGLTTSHWGRGHFVFLSWHSVRYARPQRTSWHWRRRGNSTSEHTVCSGCRGSSGVPRWSIQLGVLVPDVYRSSAYTPKG